MVYEINPWMHVSSAPDSRLARKQWEDLYTLLSIRMDVDVELIAPHAGLPDMVFTANAGVVDSGRFVPGRLRYPQRQGETPYFNRWFATHEFSVQPIPNHAQETHEGEGDSLFWRNQLVCGYGFRSDKTVHCALGEMLGRDVVALHLIDPRWYHLDTCFVPLTADLIAYFPLAFDDAGQSVIEHLPGEKIVLSEADALNFAANAVVLGKHVVLHSGSTEFETALRARGLRVHATDLSEFLKSGGSAKCLALLLEH
ncbi:MAG: dimethylarginine dimethylaminohydrolase family protein [Capsulimonadaceae bacterium]